MSDSSFKKAEWILKSHKVIACPDIPLTDVLTKDVVIGRTNIGPYRNYEFLSHQHCSFKHHPDGLLLKSLAKFDVISVGGFINGTLLKKDEETLVTDKTKLVLCQKFFKYTLCKVSSANDINGSNSSNKKVVIPPATSLKLRSATDAGCYGINDYQIPVGAPTAKKARTSRADQFFAEEESSQINSSSSSSSSSSSAAHISTSDANAALHFDHIEYENRTREGVNMSLADIESSVCMRSQTALSTTKSLCRTLLSSFYCDICLEVIASCRSCVPCGHSYCAPCIQGVINAAGRFSTASCPKCRTKVTQVIPNKTVDAAISDCLTNIKEVSTTVKAMRMPAVVTESQDIGAWNDRYELNEAPTRPPPRVTITAAVAQPAPVYPPMRTGAYYNYYRDDNGGEEVDYYDCTVASVEFAASGRSTCIHCNTRIAEGTFRFVITVRGGHFEGRRFMHLTCGVPFNSQRREDESKLRYSGLIGLEEWCTEEQKQQIRDALPGYP